jgi:hypothetical protein
MADTAKGPAAGYIFQFEKALLMLSKLDKNDFISVENVDDIAVHKNGSVFITIQAKHSISSSGTTFQDTSYSLWRTLQIWIQKIEKGIFTEETQFVCSTNKVIPKDSLLRFIKLKLFSEVVQKIEILLETQRKKLEEVKIKDKSSGNSIKKIIQLIEYVLNKKHLLEIVKERLFISDKENIRENFYNQLNLGSKKITPLQRDNIFDNFYGWLVQRCVAKWCNNKIATLTKFEFDDKWYHINTNSSIIEAIFRTKKQLDTLDIVDHFIIQKLKPELFVQQIEDIEWRSEAKERIIKDAIINFIYRDNELNFIIDDGNYTQVDFDEFVENCLETWQKHFDIIISKENSDYSKEEKNDLAKKIFLEVMNEKTLKFKESIEFNISNEYFLKGSFLKLSNIPRIGWHPEWNEKYKKNDETR